MQLDNRWYDIDADAAVNKLETDANGGLSSEEAGHRLGESGPNTLPEAQRAGLGQLFAQQFRDLMIQIPVASPAVEAFVR